MFLFLMSTGKDRSQGSSLVYYVTTLPILVLYNIDVPYNSKWLLFWYNDLLGMNRGKWYIRHTIKYSLGRVNRNALYKLVVGNNELWRGSQSDDDAEHFVLLKSKKSSKLAGAQNTTDGDRENVSYMGWYCAIIYMCICYWWNWKYIDILEWIFYQCISARLRTYYTRHT